jgi:hypothetical protein
MKIDIDREVATLEGMSTGQLRERFTELFGEPVRTRHKTYLIRKIAWRLQAMAEGDLSERARRRAAELANDAEVRVMPPKPAAAAGPATVPSNPAASADPRLPRSGTALVRKYKGRLVRVIVLADGFEYEGERFNSLTAVAKAITGSHCNGFRFFKLEGDR